MIIPFSGLVSTLIRPRPRAEGTGRALRPASTGALMALAILLANPPATCLGQAIDKATLDRVKDATVYIKLKAGQLQGSGSGFVMRVTGDTVLVMTNRHVAAPDRDELPKDAKVELACVFRSGTGQEQELPAKLLAYDEREVRDLAVLEVKGVRQPPSPISADATAAESEYYETMQSYALGFPLGGMIQHVAGNVKANPAVTVNSMTISSLRKDAANKLARVQFAGSMIEGNSGGPVVDAKGRLVGVVVSRLRGEAVGFAIPPSVIAAFLAGEVGEVIHAELLGSIGPATQVKFAFRMIDPLNKIKAAGVKFARQSAAGSPGTPNPGGGYPLMTVGTDVPLMIHDGVASATFNAPINSPDDHKIMVQVYGKDPSGRLIGTCKPFPVTLPDRLGVINGIDMEMKPKLLAKWSCETNLGEGIRMSHKPGTTTIDLPANVAVSCSPQYNLFNSPCALAKISGDFIATVAVENTFDPGGEGITIPSGQKLKFSFQSAGILVWQDEKNFVRLERSKVSDGNIAIHNRVLVEVYKNGKEAAIHYIDVPEAPVALAVVRKGGSIRLLFALPPKSLAVFHEMAVDLSHELFVGVAAANLSKRPFTAKLENFSLKTLGGEDIEPQPFKLAKLVQDPFVKLPDGTRIFEGAMLKTINRTDSPVVQQNNMADTFKGEWSDNRQLLWSNEKAGSALQLELPIDADGKYEVKGKFTKAPDYAIVKLEIDGKPLNAGKRIDFYAEKTSPTALMSLGTFALNKGKRKLTVTVFAKNPKSSSFKFGLDELRLVPVK